jgi:hypothetical protein
MQGSINKMLSLRHRNMLRTRFVIKNGIVLISFGTSTC